MEQTNADDCACGHSKQLHLREPRSESLGRCKDMSCRCEIYGPPSTTPEPNASDDT